MRLAFKHFPNRNSLIKKGYYVIVLDKSFDIKQKRLSDDIVTKLKRELNNGISRGE